MNSKPCGSYGMRRPAMRGARGLGQPALFCLLLIACSARAPAGQVAARISPAEINQRVIGSLPARRGKSADIVYRLDLTGLFDTRTQWTFVAATLPGSRIGAPSGRLVKSGTLAQCFVNKSEPHCAYATPPRPSSMSWYSIPVHFGSARTVFAGPNHSHPLLLIRAISARGGNASHAIFTELFRYDRRKNRFESVFSHSTGSNNNQETRFMEHGPLRGDVIVAEPTSKAPYAYWVCVYVRDGDGRHFVRAVRFRSATRYGDGNALSVIDSEMPDILERFGRWMPGDPLPIPRRLPGACTPHFFLRHGEEWCLRK